MELMPTQQTENEFTFGTFPAAITVKKNEIIVKKIERASVHDYKKNLTLLHKKTYNDAQIKGTLLHEILAKINSPKDIEKAIHTTIIDKPTIGYYTNTTKKIINFLEENNWFDKNWKHINERTVFYNAKEIRIDKILISEQQCIVIDYKTGEKEKKHTTQIKEYMQACKEQFTQQVSAYLFYIDTLELQKVEE
jgi:hypothetical protein